MYLHTCICINSINRSPIFKTGSTPLGDSVAKICKNNFQNVAISDTGHNGAAT